MGKTETHSSQTNERGEQYGQAHLYVSMLLLYNFFSRLTSFGICLAYVEPFFFHEIL